VESVEVSKAEFLNRLRSLRDISPFDIRDVIDERKFRMFDSDPLWWLTVMATDLQTDAVWREIERRQPEKYREKKDPAQ
jgi:hypothetical protein